MKKIDLGRDDFTLVDDEDYPLLSRHHWTYNRENLAVTSTIGNMARVILGAKRGHFVDHINRDPLDNRKENLRFATRAQNVYNAGPYRGRKLKGVYKLEGQERWWSQIAAAGKVMRLGTFESEIEAIRVYNAASKKYHGDFGYQNPIPEFTVNPAQNSPETT